ncbi:MAG: hypothetical protein U1E28_11315 [Beijerinckiaceae bacterium]
MGRDLVSDVSAVVTLTNVKPLRRLDNCLAARPGCDWTAGGGIDKGVEALMLGELFQ